MLSREENELVTRVGQGTPMGNTMRRYWIPAAARRARSPSPTARPLRVRLLGEDLVAFRDTEGPHRPDRRTLPASSRVAVFGRNEECGLRCVYHGWKFDISGACVDMMNEPPENRLQA